ncbi:MAG: DinB family protein [Chloroflexota bacterium]|nr:DinB family protein [Chloroflexota bacterium]
MAQRSEEFAKRFEQVNSEFAQAVESSSDAQWRAVCKDEGWPFGVTAHHAAVSTAGISGLVSAIVAGAAPALTQDQIDAGNAAHAKEQANCTREETAKLLRDNGVAAAQMVRGLSDEQLAKQGSFVGHDMTAGQAIEGVLIGHVAGHLASLKAAAPA